MLFRLSTKAGNELRGCVPDTGTEMQQHDENVVLYTTLSQ
jgi:hypothetical protein